MSDRPWLSAYPEGVPADIDVQAYSSLVQLLEQAFQRFGPRVAFSFMGLPVGRKKEFNGLFIRYLMKKGENAFV